MTREIVTLPRDLMRALSVDWDIDVAGQSGPRTITARDTTVYSGYPRWVGSPSVVLHGDMLRQWRAIRWAAAGRVNIYRVPMIDPLGYDGPALLGSGATGLAFEGGEVLGAGFEPAPFVAAAADYTRGATSIRVDTSTGAAAPRVGQIMSWNDWPFGVVSALQVSADLWDLEIRMPLRADVPAGGLIRCEAVGLFAATEDNAGRVAYGAAQIAEVQLSFSEVLTR